MSVLLTGLDDELTEVLARRLMQQADEVRIVLAETSDRERWSALGIPVAVGDLSDEDFVWRACTNVRTVVAGDAAPLDQPDVREGLPGLLAKTDADRLVVVGAEDDDRLVRGTRASGLSHVVLRFRKRGLLRQRDAVSLGDLAVAIDAADDLAGEPRLDLELWDPASWQQLRLEPPR